MNPTNKGMGKLLFYNIKYLIFESLVGRSPKKLKKDKKNIGFLTRFDILRNEIDGNIKLSSSKRNKILYIKIIGKSLV
jgi:hypothetical protein